MFSVISMPVVHQLALPVGNAPFELIGSNKVQIYWVMLYSSETNSHPTPLGSYTIFTTATTKILLLLSMVHPMAGSLDQLMWFPATGAHDTPPQLGWDPQLLTGSQLQEPTTCWCR